MTKHLLEVNNLETHFHTDKGLIKAVDGVDFVINENETLGVVGESGCGKSVTSLSVMQLLDVNGKVANGEINFRGENLLNKSAKEIQEIRGNEISMIFQEPMTSLNPVHKVGDQIIETLRAHQKLSKREALHKAVEMLKLVGIPSPEIRVHEYPHQMSGGMRQRVMIAIALACEPKLLIADEPTTALDVTIQAQILDLMRNLKSETGASVMIITHDLGVVAEMADNIAVLYAGKLVEYGDVDGIFNSPKHPYTIGLLESIPRLTDQRGKKLHTIEGSIPDPKNPPSGCAFHPRCRYAVDCCAVDTPPITSIDGKRQVRCWIYHPERSKKFSRNLEISVRVDIKTSNSSERIITEQNNPLVEINKLKKFFPVRGGVFNKTIGQVRAVDKVSLTINQGETLGLVGESGCGKTTVGRMMLRLLDPSSGSVLFDGKDVFAQKRLELRSMRRDMQIIFQDPYASLNPRMTIADTISESFHIHKIDTGSGLIDRTAELMRTVGMEPEHMQRYPHQFSGGQRQRIGIARAIALNPKFIVCDEPVSALDVSIQAQVINLLEDLQHSMGLTYLFIAHDLSVVKHISDRIAVMYLGKIVEMAETDEFFTNTLHPYTEALLSAVPIPDTITKRKQILLTGDVPSPRNPPPGCSFHTRCRYATDQCRIEEPQLLDVGKQHFVACHLKLPAF
jgi:peptide/nickel transport system ATP-binding protein